LHGVSVVREARQKMYFGSARKKAVKLKKRKKASFSPTIEKWRA